MAKEKPEDQDLTDGADRYPDVVSRHRPGRITECIRRENEITFVTENHVVLVITPLTTDIIRLNYALDGDFTKDFSYAISETFEPGIPDFEFEEHNEYYSITTATLECRVTKDRLLVHFYDTGGNAICEDKHGFYRRDSLMKGISEVKVTKKVPEDAAFFGLGDKPHQLDLRGRAFENWNTDSYAYERGDDPLYRSVPFYLSLTDEHGYGIFFDNTYRTRFSFDRKQNGIGSFSAVGGKMNYYFINGPDLREATRRYTRLTGTPELPPFWSLGYHQCRWSYYPESRVREIAEKFRELEIPCDAIYLDIDYMEDYKVFTWNRDHFPDPGKMVEDLKKDGFKTVVMIDPGVRVERGYEIFEEGKEKEYFCKRPDGEMMIGPVWPPRCAFPDYTDPEVRNWWAGLYKELLEDIGIAGIWNDMNEPAVFEVTSKTFPEDIRHDFDGHPCSHKKAHNIYGMQMARASLEGIRRHRPGKRPFLLTRANYAGGQRYAALWTGDNIASWDHLKLANSQCQQLSISGYSFCGSDIGGFVKTPSPELYIRWLQLGVFHPLFRTHSMGYNTDGASAVMKDDLEKRKLQDQALDQEPWSFGEEITEISRETISLRYRLLDYLYTAFRQYTDRGTPIISPLVFFDQSDPKTLEHDDQFLFGDHLLISPVLEKGKTEKSTYLPKGDWFHYWNGRRYEGGQTVTTDAPLERIPIFVRAGAVIPLREKMQYTDQKPPETSTLLVYHSDKKTQSHLYEDRGEGLEYRDDEYRLTTFTLQPGGTAKGHQVILSANREGSYRPSYSRVEIILIGFPESPGSITVDGESMDTDTVTHGEHTAHRLQVEPGFNTVEIRE